MDLSKARAGQEKSFTTAIQRLAEGESQTALVLPCGYGKSHLIRMIAFEAWNNGLAACTLVVSPNEYLRDQLVDNDNFARFVQLFHPVARQRAAIKYTAIKNVGVNYNANKEFLLSSTIQLVSRNVDNFAKWIQSLIETARIPVVVIVDETHTNSEKNVWGETLAILKAAGAHIIVMTATAMREDGEPLFGFETVEIRNEPITITKTRPAQDPQNVHVEIWSGTRTHFELNAHSHVTFKDAWNEGVLCHVNHHPFDIELSKIDAGFIENKMLSDLSDTETRKELGKLVRHPEVIRRGCEVLSLWLTRLRAAGFATRDCAAIVFCSNDGKDDERTNDHAERIKSTLLAIDPSLKILIATSADDTGGKGPSGKKILEDFVYRGIGDVIIVKQMAGLGLDAPRLKVALDLSPVRTPTSFIQRSNRVTRPYQGIMVAHLITLADALSQACFSEFIESQGGATTKDLELKEEYDVPKEDKQKPVFNFRGLSDFDLRDTKDKRAARQLLSRVLDVFDAFPLLQTGYTIPDVAEKLAVFGALVPERPENDSATGVNTGDEVDRLKAAILPSIKDVVRIRMLRQGRRYTRDPKDQALYQETIKQSWKDVYKLARMPEDFDYQKSTDVPMLNAVLSAVEDLLDSECVR